MRMVVKVAGALLEETEHVRAIAAQVAELAADGHEILVVHGGGKILLPRWRVWGSRAAL